MTAVSARLEGTGLAAPGTRAVLAGGGLHVAGSALPHLRSVVPTLDALERVLSDVCGMSHVHRLPAEAEASDVVAAVEEAVKDAVGPVLFGFVGHGILGPGDELYLAMYASAAADQIAHAVPYQTMKNLLSRAPGGSVVVLDCCFSGLAGVPGAPLREPYVSARPHGSFLLSSASDFAFSFAPDNERHTLFTGRLLKLLEEGDLAGPPWLTLDHVHTVLAREFRNGPVWPHRQSEGTLGELIVAPNHAYAAPPGPDAEPPADVPCPYPGMRSFEAADHQWFCGREDLTQRLLNAAGDPAQQHPIVLVGASGAGKSSLLGAGLLAGLERRHAQAPGDELWPALLLSNPGSDPMGALASLWATASGRAVDEIREALADGRFPPPLPGRRACRLLVIDQFEEIFTHGADGYQRRRVIRLLFGMQQRRDPGTRPRVVLALRADHYGDCLVYPELQTALANGKIDVPPMDLRSLRAAIERPAARAGLTLEDRLVDRLLLDLRRGGTEDEPVPASTAPFLAHALAETWRHRSGARMTLAGYQRTGGIWESVTKSADDLYKSLDEGGRRALRDLLLTMVHLTPGGGASGRPARVVDLLDGHAGQDTTTVRKVWESLLDLRLVTANSDSARISHDALLHAWSRLRCWIRDARTDLLTHQRLTEAAAAWQEHGQDRVYLYEGSRLDQVRSWAALDGNAANPALTTLERKFLTACLAMERHTTRRRRLFQSGLGVVMVLALVFGTLFAYTQRESRQHQAVADSRALTQAAQDDAAKDPAQAVMLAIAAYRTAPTQEARNELLRQYVRYSATNRVLSGLLGTIGEFQTSRDGNVVFATSTLGRAMLFVHAATGTVRSEPLSFPDQVTPVMVSADGRRAGFSTVHGVVYWFAVDPNAARPIGPLHKLPEVPGGVHGYTMSPDGRMIAITLPHRLVWWDLGSGTIGGSVPAPADTNGDLWIAPDDRHVLVGTGVGGMEGLAVIDKADGRTRRMVATADQTLLPSGDGTAVVVCRKKGDEVTLSLWRVADGAPLTRPYRSQYATCEAADATGHRVVLDDGSALRLVDLDRRTDLAKTPKLSDSPDGSRALVSAGGKMYFVAQADSQITFTRVSGAKVFDVGQSILTADGSKVISVLKDGSRLLLEQAAPDRVLAEAPRPRPYWVQQGDHLRLSPDGRLFADRESANVVSVREVSTLRQVARITTATPPVASALSFAFDDTGNLVTASGAQIQQWDSRSGRQTAHFDASVFGPAIDKFGWPSIRVATYPTPGQVAVLAVGDPVVHIVDIRTGRTTATLKTADDATAIKFDSTGRYFVLLRHGGIVELWRRHPLRRELVPLRGLSDSAGEPYAARFLDGKGRFLLAASNAIRIYQVGRRADLDSYDFGQPSGDLSSLFSASTPSYSFIDAAANGKVVLYSDPRGIGGPLVLDPALWQRKLCGIIGDRAFTAEERASLPIPVSAKPVCQNPS